MYNNICQHGLITVLYSIGNRPFRNWRVENKNGIVKRHTDEILNSLVLNFRGPNPVNNYIECPKDPKESLGIRMRYFHMIMRNADTSFSFEVEIIDRSGFKRIFRVNNFSPVVLVHPFAAVLPINLYPNWNTIVLDLEKLTHDCYRISYSQTSRIVISANFTVRRIFFSDRPYRDAELPEAYKFKITPNLQAPLI